MFVCKHFYQFWIECGQRILNSPARTWGLTREKYTYIGYSISAETHTVLEFWPNIFLQNMLSITTIHADVFVSSQDGRLRLKHRHVYITKHNVSETGFCLRLEVKPTQLGPTDRASPSLRTSVPAPRWGIQAKHSTNHLRELRKH
jgi:hypothetical protein